MLEQRLDTFATQTIMAYQEAKAIALEAKTGQDNMATKIEGIRSKLSDDILSINESIQDSITELTQKMCNALKEAGNMKRTMEEQTQCLQ